MSMSTKQNAADLRDFRAFGLEGIRRKIKAVTTGRSPVSKTCQIENLRAIYDAVGFLPTSGVFVEVGGFDGESFSNTSFLADQGWRGIYVEPIPTFARQIRYRHLLNKVRVEQFAVTDGRGQIDISVMGALTTINKATEDAYKTIEWAQDAESLKTTLTVATDDLVSILERNAVPQRFELLIVDVEGAEEPVIRSLLRSAWRPKMIIIELADRHASFTGFGEIQESHARVRAEILQAGYHEKHSDEINTILVLN